MKDVKGILISNRFAYSHSLGQNFITDRSLLDAIVEDAGISADDTVVEIGAGAGTLTAALAHKAKRVITYEIDTKLKPILIQTLSEFDNVEVQFRDIMSVKTNELAAKTGGEFKVVANLPYYITTPIMFYFLESDLPFRSLTVMVQKEVAERITAKPNSRDYGILTLSVQSRATASITREVPRIFFYPQPNVDSAVVRIDMKDERLSNQNDFDKVVRAAFAMRRKTLANNLIGAFGLERATAEDIIATMDLKPNVRGEELSLQNYEQLSQLLNNYLSR